MYNSPTNSLPIGEGWGGAYNENAMNKLEKKEGVYYTQNIENLPIEERVFFREGKGISATSENYRQATADEISSWKAYQAQQEMQN